jgi:hypothetical protein
MILGLRGLPPTNGAKTAQEHFQPPLEIFVGNISPHLSSQFDKSQEESLILNL